MPALKIVDSNAEVWLTLAAGSVQSALGIFS